MKLYISSDHAGYELKEHLVGFLMEKSIEVTDKGPFDFVEGDDYPDWISKTAAEISQDPENNRGIVLGHTGQGEAIVANKFKNVRAGVYYGGPEEIVKLLREHNNINVLSLGTIYLTKEEAEKAITLFLETPFANEERHVRRLKKISEIDTEV